MCQHYIESATTSLLTQNTFINDKKICRGWLNTSQKNLETKDELSITLYLQSER